MLDKKHLLTYCLFVLLFGCDFNKKVYKMSYKINKKAAKNAKYVKILEMVKSGMFQDEQIMGYIDSFDMGKRCEEYFFTCMYCRNGR